MSWTDHPTLRWYASAIDAAAGDLDPALVAALILVESGGRADAFRFEPQYAQRYRITAHPIYKQWPVRAVASSYSLMQIMFPTAYELGFRGEPEALFLPTTNLHWGCKNLQACFEWAASFHQSDARTLQGALCGYNGGRNSSTSPMNPRPPNIAYAGKVLSTLAGFVQRAPS